MEETEPKIAINTPSEKDEINWAQYFDCTKYFEPAEINNVSLELFTKDFEKK